jgi:hypothetical protein
LASVTPGIESNPGNENAGLKTPSPLLTNDWFSIGRVERSSRMRGRFDPEHLGSEHNVVAYTSAVPKQESTGDRTILGKISKRGNKYMRTLFVQAAHVVLVRRPSTAKRGLWPWIAAGIEAAAPQHAGDRKVRPTSRGLLQMPRDKGQGDTRHHRSPHWASERRWLRGDGFT